MFLIWSHVYPIFYKKTFFQLYCRLFHRHFVFPWIAGRGLLATAPRALFNSILYFQYAAFLFMFPLNLTTFFPVKCSALYFCVVNTLYFRKI